MKLSQKNIDKLILTGLYKAKPNVKYRGRLYEDNLYHCFNWTFKLKYYESKDTYYMVDTYFNDKSIELTNDNIGEFTLIFDFNDVKPHSGNNIYDYDESDYYHVAIDSGGMYCGGKYFIKNDAIKNKQKVLDRLKSEIDNAKWKLELLEKDYVGVKNETVDLKYV